MLALNEISLFLKNKKWRNIIVFSFLGVFLWNTYDQIRSIREESQFWHPYESNDVEKVYDYLKEKGDSGDIATQLTFTHLPVLRVDDLSLYNRFFYQPDNHPKITTYHIIMTNNPPYFHESKRDKIYYINWDDMPRKEEQKIFFITSDHFVEKEREDQAPSVLSSIMEEIKVGRFSIFQWTLEKIDKEKQYKVFLSDLIKKMNPKYSASLYETLLFYACKNKDDKRFNELLNKYRALESTLNEFVTVKNLPARFVLKRRVDIFKRPEFCLN